MVVDANILAAYYLERGPRHDRTRARMRYECEWLAPALWRSEFLSVLRKYMKQGGLTRTAALVAHADAESVITTSGPPEAAMILDISTESGCSVYDAEYVATAVTAGSQLMTYDRFLLDRFPKIAMLP